MQVSAQNSLTWLQTTPAAVAAADQVSSAYGQVSPGDDANGAEQGQSAISALQSPAQMFAPSSLDTLISAQSDTGSTDATSSAAGQAPPAHGHHHHRHGGVEASTSTPDPTTTTTDADTGADTAGAAATGAATADASVTADLSQVLANL